MIRYGVAILILASSAMVALDPAYSQVVQYQFSPPPPVVPLPSTPSYSQGLAACRTDVCNLIGNDGFAGVNVHLTLDRVRSALLRSPSTFNRDVLAPV